MAQDAKFVLVDVEVSTNTWVSVLGQTSGSLDYTVDVLETTDKLSKDPSTGVTHKTYIGGHRDGTITVEGNVKEGSTGWDALYAIYLAGGANNAKAKIRYGSEEPGKKFYTQNAILSNLSRSGADNTIETYTANFQKTGVPTQGTTSS
jgi:hypothetical protein